MNAAAEDTADPEETLKRAGTLSFEELSALAFDRLRLRLSRLKGSFRRFLRLLQAIRRRKSFRARSLRSFPPSRKRTGCSLPPRAEALAGERLPNAPPATKLSGKSSTAF